MRRFPKCLLLAACLAALPLAACKPSGFPPNVTPPRSEAKAPPAPAPAKKP